MLYLVITVSLKSEYEEFLQDTEQIRQEIDNLRKSAEDLNIDENIRAELLEVIQDFWDAMYAIKMDLTPRGEVDKSTLIQDYRLVLKGIEEERNFRERFEEVNKRVKKKQASKLETFFSKELNRGSNSEKLALRTLKHQHERADYFIKMSKKKGYLSYQSDYNAFKAEEEVEQISRFEENFAKQFAHDIKKAGFEYGEKVLENRPVIYISRKALEKASQTTKKSALQGDVKETSGVFKSKRLGNQKILLKDFTNWDSFDDKDSTAISQEHTEEMWGESGRNLIFWHCHPKASEIEVGARYADRLSNSDIDLMTTTVNKGNQFGFRLGEKVGIREGITLLSTPWDHHKTPQEDVVWLACAVSSQGGESGFFNLHVVENNGGNINKIDSKYSWPQIYNKWIKYAMASPESIGPYSEFQKVKSLEEELNLS